MCGASCEAVLHGCALTPGHPLPQHVQLRVQQVTDTHTSLPSAGGPAEKAGLQQLDTVLQLNEQPVEHWKCVDLAHEIR